MTYTPTTWAKGDVVTSAKLNKLEQGVASARADAVVLVTPGEDDAYSAELVSGDFAAVKAMLTANPVQAVNMLVNVCAPFMGDQSMIGQTACQVQGIVYVPAEYAVALISMASELITFNAFDGGETTYSLIWLADGRVGPATDFIPS